MLRAITNNERPTTKARDQALSLNNKYAISLLWVLPGDGIDGDDEKDDHGYGSVDDDDDDDDLIECCKTTPHFLFSFSAAKEDERGIYFDLHKKPLFPLFFSFILAHARTRKHWCAADFHHSCFVIFLYRRDETIDYASLVCATDVGGSGETEKR